MIHLTDAVTLSFTVDVGKWYVIGAQPTEPIWLDHKLYRTQVYPAGSRFRWPASLNAFVTDVIRKCDLLSLLVPPLHLLHSHSACLATLAIYANHPALKAL